MWVPDLDFRDRILREGMVGRCLVLRIGLAWGQGLRLPARSPVTGHRVILLPPSGGRLGLRPGDPPRPCWEWFRDPKILMGGGSCDRVAATVVVEQKETGTP